MKIVVNTPAGNIGRSVVDQLLKADQSVVIISRHPNKVAELVARGAALIEGSIDDPSVLSRAFSGADALFWVTPFAPDQPDFLRWARKTGQQAAEAARSQGVKRAVVLSSVGAQHETGVGPIGCMPVIEAAFRASVPDVTSLRAASFMENYLQSVGTIAHTGSVFGSHPADRKIPLVAACDIARKASEALLDREWSGFRVVGVHGPEDLAPSRAAEIIAAGIGRPVAYVEVPVEQLKAGMLKSGMPQFMADLMAELYQGFRAGRVASAEPRSEETTTETSLFEFSRRVLKPAVEAAGLPG
jgi:uncharacterized protein YbjT (DUF2867 family)